ncbi:MAG: 7,8-didemethyl-8-hydroxy-5-deazariboflavin synthase subunit CofH [Candidatus Schekmanbacteria bacterium]|nr:MAG: 7,8-didemethyl-8-hydroxy-5-deazariboflavin synthase subunit CofH [Candidatus Schekmanbacteria bacterium]
MPTEKIIEKALSRKDLSLEETKALLEIESAKELEFLYQSADSLRASLCGNIVTYVKNRNINFTNICRNKCKFCAFRKDSSDEKSYCMSIDEILEKINPNEITEVCIQGGLNEDLNLDYYIEILNSVKKKYPFIHIHAFSPMEIFFLAEKSGKTVAEILRILKENGLDSMPGTAAEILSDDVRMEICPEKLSVNQWIDVIKCAHKTGIPTTSTIMFGHIESTLHIAKHLHIVKSIQKETMGFTEFVPLPFVSKNTRLAKERQIRKEENNNLIYKVYAVSRLLFGNLIRNIQASWVKIGVEGVKKALSLGVNDIGGTLGEEKISKAAGAIFGESLSENELKDIILSAGKTPLQRDTLYRPVERQKYIHQRV